MEEPTIEEVSAAARSIAPYLFITPTHHWRGPGLEAAMGEAASVMLKLELFQVAGSFKGRSALVNMLALDKAARARGVTTVSAGNHAVAVSWAAAVLGISAKVVIQSSANPARVALARSFGSEVIIGGDGPACFALVDRIVAEEGRTFVHPFEGRNTAIGTGTLGLEIVDAMTEIDALILPVGGGGLAGGVANVVKKLRPEIRIYGVEPEGADSMRRSFDAGSPQKIDKVSTIADSLAPPMALPFSYGLCRKNVDRLVLVDDQAICRAMLLLFNDMKLAVEPAAAATTAAITGPLREELSGKRVGTLICGTNIDAGTHAALLERARQS